MPLQPPTPSHESLVRTNEYEVTTDLRGAFLLVSLRGRYTEDVLTVLQKQVFLQMRSLALDASALSGMTMALARAVCLTLTTSSSALTGRDSTLRTFIRQT